MADLETLADIVRLHHTSLTSAHETLKFHNDLLKNMVQDIFDLKQLMLMASASIKDHEDRLRRMYRW